MPWVKMKEAVKEVYQFKIALQGISPPIWRRIQISGDSTFANLHHDIQMSMGWMDSHLHEFYINATRIGSKGDGFEIDDDSDDVLDETQEKISSWFSVKSSAGYIYDFGDTWEHTITLEKILEPTPKMIYPTCIAGKRACPPEDCGGAWGYQELLKTFQAKKNKEKLDDDQKELLKWSQIKDPEKFDPKRVSFISY